MSGHDSVRGGGGRQMMRAGMGAPGLLASLVREGGIMMTADGDQHPAVERDQGYGLCKLAPFLWTIPDHKIS